MDVARLLLEHGADVNAADFWGRSALWAAVEIRNRDYTRGNEHDHDPLPVILAGGAAGQMKGGRHVQNAPHTPMSNLLLSVLDKLGIDQDSHGDSTGKLEI